MRKHFRRSAWRYGVALAAVAATTALDAAPAPTSGNLLHPDLASLDDASALKRATYMRGGKEAKQDPDRFYRFLSEDAYRGAGCLRMTTYGNWRYGMIFHGPGPAKKGERFTASAYVRADVTKPVSIFVWADDGKFRPKSQHGEHFKIGTKWQQIRASGALRQDVERVHVLIRVPAKDESDRNTVYIDELKLERGTQATPSEPDTNAKATAKTDDRFRIAHVVPFCSQPPKLDAKFDDACWADALVLDQFLIRDGSGRPAPQKTVVRMLYNDANLYFAVRCDEPEIGKLKGLSKLRDKPDWGDDRVELFFNVLGIPRPPTYYLSITPFAVLCDSAIGLGKWDPNVEIATGRADDAWLLEVKLPLASMGKNTISGEVWRMNIGRHHRTSMTISTSLIGHENGFHMPSHFRNVLFARAEPAKDVDVVCLTRGEMSPLGNRIGSNRVIYRVTRHVAAPVKLAFTVESKLGNDVLTTDTMTRTITVADALVEQYYRIKATPGEQVVFRVNHGTADGKALYYSTNELDKIRAYRTVWPVKDPLYEPLLDNTRKRNPRTNGFLSWWMPASRGEYYCAIQFGYEHNYAQVRQELTEAGIHLFGHWSAGVPTVLKDWSDRWKARANPSFERCIAEARDQGLTGPALYSPYYAIGVDDKGQRGVNFRGAAGWLPDPVNQQGYIDTVREAVRRFGNALWAVSPGDELFAHVLGWSKRHVFDKERPPDDKVHPFYLQVDREVLAKYGFGKFGIPWGMKPNHPDYPYCRRAYLSWLVDRVRLANRKLAAAVGVVDPEMYIISEDGHNGLTLGTEYWYEHAACATTQLQYHFPNAYTLGCKVMKDLSGLDEIMPVPHDCDSGFPHGELQLDELRELYSQCFRGGATSFHFWPASYPNRSPIPPTTKTVRSAHPLAWRYLIALCKHIRQMPRLKHPDEAVAALFISRESNKCGSVNGRRVHMPFEVLGPRARGWFKFVSDTQLAIGRARLADYKIVYLSDITYCDEATATALVEFCRAGGTIVCGDPLAFEHNIDGESLAHVREQLFGVRVGKPRGTAEVVLVRDFLGLRGQRLSVNTEVEKAYAVELARNTARVVGAFDDGGMAIVENRLGTGRALYFAWSPFNNKALEDEGWQELIKATYTSAGGAFGYDVWRFTFPELEIDEPDNNPPGKCLTGNYAFWDQYRMIEGTRHNVATGGTVTIDADGKKRTTPIGKGMLTNRLLLLDKPHLFAGGFGYGQIVKFKPHEWAETFTGSQPVQITFDFKRPYPLDRVRTFFHGELSGVEAETSADGRTWQPAGSQVGQRTGFEEVALLHLPLTATSSARHLRLTFKRENSGQAALALCEMEVWSK